MILAIIDIGLIGVQVAAPIDDGAYFLGATFDCRTTTGKRFASLDANRLIPRIAKHCPANVDYWSSCVGTIVDVPRCFCVLAAREAHRLVVGIGELPPARSDNRRRIVHTGLLPTLTPSS